MSARPASRSSSTSWPSRPSAHDERPKVPAFAALVLLIGGAVLVVVLGIAGNSTWDVVSNGRHLDALVTATCDAPPPRGMRRVSCTGSVHNPGTGNACVFDVRLVLSGPMSASDVLDAYPASIGLAVDETASRPGRPAFAVEDQRDANWDVRCN